MALRSERDRLLSTERVVTILLFGPGDVFGFLPFLDGEPYPAYAQALEDTEARVMSRDQLLSAVRADPQVGIALIGLVGGRLRKAIRRLESPSASPRKPSPEASRSSCRPESSTALGPGRFQVLDPEALRQSAESVVTSRTPLS